MTVPLELSETLELALVVPVVLWLSDKLLLGESELLGLAVAVSLWLEDIESLILGLLEIV